MADKQKPCLECGSPIADTARVCPVCKSFQQRWKSGFQFYSSNIALLTAIVSVLLWTGAQTPKWWTGFFPKTSVITTACNSADGAVLYNAGDVPVFISHVMLFSKGHEWSGQGQPVDNILEPGKFLKVSSPAKTFDGLWVRRASPDQLAKLINSATALSDCAHIIIFAKNDPLFREVSENAGPTLNTLEAGGYIEYFSAGAPNVSVRTPIAAVAAIMANFQAGCPEAPF
jgi:hypothetical protein